MESLQPPPSRVELKDIPRLVKNEHNEDVLNVVWVREWARQQKEDQQIAHTEASLPTDALNKGAEPVQETAKRVFQTRCTCSKKAEGCKGYTYATNLMPKVIYDDKGKPLGTEEWFVVCHNASEKTWYKEKEFKRLASDERFKRFNRVDKPKNLERLEHECKQQHHKMVVKERIARRQAGFKGKDVNDGPIARMGSDGYWLMIQEMRIDPQLKGPD